MKGCEPRPVARALLAAALLLALAPAWAQDDTRRRPGQGADRGSPPPAQTPAPAPRSVPTSTSEQPTAPADPGLRRRPGEAPVAAPPPAPVPDSAPVRRRAPTTPLARPAPAGRGLTGRSGERQQMDPNAAGGLTRVAKPTGESGTLKPHEDRWQITRQLGLTDTPWWNPYAQNTLKADRPVHGHEWFFNLGLISDTVIEPLKVPVPVGAQGEAAPDQLNVLGNGEQLITAQNFITQFVYFKGDTTFKPPDWEYRLTLAFNLNRVEAEQARLLQADPREGTDRNDSHVGVQDLFVDKHLRNVSERYDFDSLRVGIQPVTLDFRGFLFRDQQLGIRLFGNRRNNLWQYNLGWFRRLEKDTNSGLNTLQKPLRKDDVIFANAYRQDFPVLGYTSQGVVAYNRNREGDEGSYFNENRFIERPASIGREAPRNYDVVYLGFNGDGHFGRLNLSNSFYYALGKTDRGVFVAEETDISALFFAAEASLDADWRRFRLSLLYASGDDDPFDDVETGFDAIFENPLFAGADTSFWVRQAVPLVGGGRVAISGRNGILNSLRSSKEEGQSNFSNPGLVLAGLGADLDLAPQFRLSVNLNQLWFADTAVVEAARNQGEIDPDIGIDASVAAIWRPLFTQNIVLRASYATLLPGKGYEQLFGDEPGTSILLNLILSY